MGLFTIRRYLLASDDVLENTHLAASLRVPFRVSSRVIAQGIDSTDAGLSAGSGDGAGNRISRDRSTACCRSKADRGGTMTCTLRA